jgi:hypothetical protein
LKNVNDIKDVFIEAMKFNEPDIAIEIIKNKWDGFILFNESDKLILD